MVTLQRAYWARVGRCTGAASVSRTTSISVRWSGPSFTEACATRFLHSPRQGQQTTFGPSKEQKPMNAKHNKVAIAGATSKITPTLPEEEVGLNR